MGACSSTGAYGCFCAKDTSPYCTQCWTKCSASPEESGAPGSEVQLDCNKCKKVNVPHVRLHKHPSQDIAPQGQPTEPQAPIFSEAEEAGLQILGKAGAGLVEARHANSCAGSRYRSTYHPRKLRLILRSYLKNDCAPKDLAWAIEKERLLQCNHDEAEKKAAEIFNEVRKQQGSVSADSILQWCAGLQDRLYDFQFAREDYAVESALWRYHQSQNG